MTETLPDPRTKAAACSYLLHMLLQRAEEREAGFIGGLIDGVVADQRGCPEDVPDRALLDGVFDETLKLLRRAQAPFVGP